MAGRPPLGITLLRPIGSGGTSTVYLGRQEGLDRLVAVKVLNGHVDDDATWRRFLREARVVARLSGHQNIVNVHTAGRTPTGEPYLVTDYMDGGSLADVVARDGPRDETAVRPIGLALADALSAAHAIGIMHRDVKPGNVLLDRDGRVKLADFGIARLADATTTSTGVALTPEYAAPEVFEQRGEGPWTDVYSLAATLVFALTGRAPVPAREGEGIAPYVVRKQHEAPDLPAQVSPMLRSVLADALSADPAARPDLASFRRALAAPTSTPTVFVPPTQRMDTIHFHDARAQGAPRRAGRGRIFVLLASILVALAAAAVAVTLLRDEDDGQAGGAPSTAPTSAPAPPTTQGAPPTTPAVPTSVALPTTTTAPAPATNPPTTPAAAPATTLPPVTAPPAPTDREALAESFVRRYYATVQARDYPTSWAMLTPEFQRSMPATYDEYVDFWNTVERIEVRDVDVVASGSDPWPIVARLTMRYTIDRRTTDELDEVTLVPAEDGDALIDAYRVVRAL